MKIVWDERKRLANIEKHGLDFRDFDIDFIVGAALFPVRSPRMKAVGLLGGNPVAVIFAPLGAEALALISARPASAKERRLVQWPN
jgi:uncharacterized DUF497 family protein